VAPSGRHLFLALPLALAGCTDSSEWEERVVSAEGEVVPVKVYFRSARRIGAGPHGTLYEDDSTRVWRLTFTYRGTEFRWDQDRQPEILSLSSSHKPIVVTLANEYTQEREARYTEYGSQTTTRFYEGNGGAQWQEISRHQYPRDLVVQNIWTAEYTAGERRRHRDAWASFPINHHKPWSWTLLIDVAQAVCGISDSDVPFPERSDAACIQDVRRRAEAQVRREDAALATASNP
jgi:hypothetical protein